MTEESTQRFGVVRLGEVFLGFPIENLIEVFLRRDKVKLPSGSDAPREGVSLRGLMIPIVGLARIAGIAADDAASKLGVILEGTRMLIAFHVEEVVGIEVVEKSAIQKISENDTDRDLLFQFGFPSGDKYITIVDVDGLLRHPGISTTDRADADRNATQSTRKPMMTFEAGGAKFAVPAVEVYAAVPKQQILETAITSGPCLGEITYHNRRVPVVCPAQILGLGVGSRKAVSEVVVMRFPEDRVVGFAVDSINDIQNLGKRDETSVSLWQAEAKLISAVHVGSCGKQIFAIDVDQLRRLKSIADIAELSKTEASPPEPDTTRAETSGSVIRERERYLVIELSDKLAIPLLQVVCILDQPKSVTPTHAAKRGFRGYFEYLGETIALIDLKEHLGDGAIDARTAQVLLATTEGRKVGFLVERILGIEVSQWRECYDAKHPSLHGTFVQLGTGENEAVLPYFDLMAHFPVLENTPDARFPETEALEDV